MHPVVTTTKGKLKGSKEDGISLFKGIPFATPPVGDLRWQAPEPVDPWSGEREALKFGFSAMQATNTTPIQELIGIPTEATKEDCLYLNVWTPGLDNKKRPVMVWIHGGGNTMGSGSQPRANGKFLAQQGDVVIVTANYRLGAFGFLYLPELGASGNEALLDQAAALRWVRQEIENFGGDPSNVTVFGQSAGGMDIVQLMGIEAAKDCFDKAVPMSGSLSPQASRDEASAIAAKFIEKFGGIDKLKKASAEEITAYQIELAPALGQGARFGPVLDGKVIKEDTADRIAVGVQTKDMPIMIGCTRDEMALFLVPNPALANLTIEGLEAMAMPIFGDKTKTIIQAHKEARKSRGQDVSPLSLWIAIMTDQSFRLPAIRLAELQSKHTSNTWMYLFDYESPSWEGRLGASHSIDIPFIWGTHGIKSMKEYCGQGEAVSRLSDVMMETYLAFARNGDPSNEALPDWPRYDSRVRATMRLGEKCFIENAPMDEERCAVVDG